LKFDISAPLPSFPSIKDAKYTLFLHFHSSYRGEARLPLLTSLLFTALLMPQAVLLQIKVSNIKFIVHSVHSNTQQPLTLTLCCFYIIPLSEYEWRCRSSFLLMPIDAPNHPPHVKVERCLFHVS